MHVAVKHEKCYNKCVCKVLRLGDEGASQLLCED